MGEFLWRSHQPKMMIRKVGQSQTKKKLVIKSLSDVPQLPSDYKSKTWSKLSHAVDAIHESSPVSDSMESLYNSVKDLCLHKFAEETYQNLRQQYQKYLQTDGRALHDQQRQSADSLALLRSTNATWDSHCRQIRMIRDIFLYLDRTYVFQTPERSLWEMGCTLFRSQVMANEELTQKLLEAILLLLERDRNNETIERSQLQNILRMLISLKLYEGSFESHILQETGDHYRRESHAKLEEHTLSFYLEYVSSSLRQERERAQLFLHPNTLLKVMEIVEREIIYEHTNTMLEKGFFTLMEENNQNDLNCLYLFLKKVRRLVPDMCNYLNAFIKKSVIEIVIDPDKDASMIEELIKHKEKIDNIMKDCFADDPNFHNTIREGFKDSINKRQNVPAELLAKYVHSVLRSGGKSFSEAELEGKLDSIIVLFRLMSGKDIFQAFYRTDLAKRLLIGKSVNEELEKLMISKLKIECGANFTSKLEGMFKDIQVSRELMGDFQQFLEDANYPYNLTVNALTMGTWPSFSMMDLNLPSEFSDGLALFEKFYQARYNGRKITWQHSMGHCTMSCGFPSGNKVIAMSLTQAVVMLLFNNANKLSLQEIKDATKIGTLFP